MEDENHSSIIINHNNNGDDNVNYYSTAEQHYGLKLYCDDNWEILKKEKKSEYVCDDTI